MKLYKLARLALVTLGLTAIAAGCLAHPMDSVPESLVGTWQGESQLRLPVVFVPPKREPGEDVQDVRVEFRIAIDEDGTVTGTVGGARLEGCALKQNRGELGRALNVASDYIVMDGYLEGSIVPEDEVEIKQFTLPFDLVENRMKGYIMWLEEWKYPRPLLKVDAANIAL